MTSSEGFSQPWCHLHSRAVSLCTSLLCGANADNQEYVAGALLGDEDGGLAILSAGLPDDAMPDAPLSSTEATGIEFYSIYDANIKAGFSPPQALYLLAVQMIGNPGIAPGREHADPDQI